MHTNTIDTQRVASGHDAPAGHEAPLGSSGTSPPTVLTLSGGRPVPVTETANQVHARLAEVEADSGRARARLTAPDGSVVLVRPGQVACVEGDAGPPEPEPEPDGEGERLEF